MPEILKKMFKIFESIILIINPFITTQPKQFNSSMKFRKQGLTYKNQRTLFNS